MVRLAVRSRLVALTILALIGTVAAMHSLAMPAHETSSMPSHVMASDMTAHLGASSTTATSPMPACASTHCAAARGGDGVAAHALPVAIVRLPTRASAQAAAAASATTSRAPPRSGSCSPLCVWRQ